MFPLRCVLERRGKAGLLEDGCLKFRQCSLTSRDVSYLMEFVLDECCEIPLRGIIFWHCQFDTKDDLMMQLLVQFFSTLKLSCIEFDSPSIGNGRISEMIQGSRDSLTELIFTWSFARAASVNRHLVFDSLHQLKKLTLNFNGLEFFADMDSDLIAALSKMNLMEELKLDGWTIRDWTFCDFVHSIQQLSLLRLLQLSNVRGLTPASLEKLAELAFGGCLHLIQCKTLFHNATCERIASFLQKLSVPSLYVAYGSLSRALQRAILRFIGMNKDPCKLTKLSWVETAFGIQEFELLLQLLPAVRLSSLFIHAVTLAEEEDHNQRSQQLELALSHNISLEEFWFADSGHRQQLFAFPSIVNRNKRDHFVQRFLQTVSMTETHSPVLLVHALAKLTAWGEQGASDVQKLLTLRFSILVQSRND